MMRRAIVLTLALSAPATAARMIDVEAEKVIDHPAVFVDNGRITAIADARTVRWGGDVRHVDLGNKTLLPGLIDMHVHLDSLAEIGGYNSLQFTDRFWSMVAVKKGRDRCWPFCRHDRG